MPTERIAERIAAEWDAQRDLIDPAKMPLTRLANAIIDGVAILFPMSLRSWKNTLRAISCSIAPKPPKLWWRANPRPWDSVLEWAAASLGARFACAAGMTFRAQSEEALDAALRRDPARAGSA